MEKSHYLIFPEEHFGIIKFKTGNLDVDEVLKINHLYKSDPHYSSINYTIIILCDCCPEFSEESLPIIAERISTYLSENNHIKRVFIVNEPMLTAYTHIITQDIFDDAAYCSTLEKAHELLGIPMSYDRFTELIPLK